MGLSICQALFYRVFLDIVHVNKDVLQNLSDDPAAHLLSVYIIFTILLYACVIPRRIHLDRIKSSPDGLSLLAKISGP